MADNYLYFRPFGKSLSGLTEIWDVVNKTNSAFLGNIRWQAGWRKYVFFPNPDTLYDANCLREIATFLDTQMELWRESHKPQPAQEL